jgi:hypothetical protein
LPPPHLMRPKRITKFTSLQIDRSERLDALESNFSGG